MGANDELVHFKLRLIALQGWQGVQTIPRSVTYDADADELLFYPVVEIEQLRQEVLYQDNVTLDQVRHFMLPCVYAICDILLHSLMM